MVPLVDGLLIADLVNYLSIPLLVVARPNLGTINQTLLTCFVAKKLEIKVSGVIINNYPERPGIAEQSAPAQIASLSGAPILGLFPHQAGFDQREIVVRLAKHLANDPATPSILQKIGAL
jgi:dethiobiotin synthetase